MGERTSLASSLLPMAVLHLITQTALSLKEILPRICSWDLMLQLLPNSRSPMLTPARQLPLSLAQTITQPILLLQERLLPPMDKPSPWAVQAPETSLC